MNSEKFTQIWVTRRIVHFLRQYELDYGLGSHNEALEVLLPLKEKRPVKGFVFDKRLVEKEAKK